MDYSENTLVEQPAIALFEELGWETANFFHEFDQGAEALWVVKPGQRSFWYPAFVLFWRN